MDYSLLNEGIDKKLAKEYAHQLGTELKSNLTKDGLKQVGRDVGEGFKIGLSDKTTLKRLAVAGLAGYGAAKLVNQGKELLKKRKEEKQADKNAKSLEECVFDIIIDDGQVFILKEDMDFLIECFGYSLSDEEIMDNIINLIAESEEWRQDHMEFELLVENGEIFVSDEEIYRLSEELQISEDEVMELISDEIEYYNEDLKEKAKECGENIKKAGKDAVAKVKGTFSKENLDKAGKKAKKAFSKDGMKEAGDKIKKAAGNTVEYVKKNPGKAAGAAAVGALAGYGAVSIAKDAHKALKKRKAKKEADRDAESLEECMIDIFVNEDGEILISQEDMDFLLECFDYELSESEVYDLIVESTVVEVDPKGVAQERDSYYPAVQNQGSYLPAVTKQPETTKKPGLAPVKVLSVGKNGLSTGKKIAIGALGAAGVAAAGYGAAKLLKKRKAKKEAEKARSLKECTIDYLISNEGEILVTRDDMDFLLECFEYELSESEICELIESTVIEVDPKGVAQERDSYYPAVQNQGSYLPAVRSQSYLPAVTTGGGSTPVADAAKKGLGTKGKIAIGALGAAGLAAAGYGAAKLLKKRKAKKEAEKAKSLKECTIDFYVTEDNVVYLPEEDMNFLLECFEYELSESEIMEDVVDALNEGLGEWFNNKKEQFNQFRKNSQETEAINDAMKKAKQGREFHKQQIRGNKEYISKAKDAMRKAGENSTLNDQRQKGIDSAKEAIKNSRSQINASRKVTAMGNVMKGVGWVDRNKGKAALGAAGLAAAAGGAAYMLKKRKAKKESDKEARRLEECMIDYVVSEDVMYVGQDDIDFLLECFDYEVDRYEIYDALLYEAQDTMGNIPGELVVITSSRELAKVEEKQLTDIPERVKDGQIGNEEIAVSTANFGKGEIRESYYYDDEAEYDEYSESFEGDHLIMEAILEDAGIELTEDQMDALINANLLSERSIVRLDKAAKRTQAEKKALVVIAREQGDPLYKKLVRVYKQKNDILNKLDSKYGTRAIARVRGNARKLDKED